jgi:hypothetical protein
VKARLKLGVVLSLSLGLAALVMLGLPLLYLTLPNPTPVPVPDIAEAGRGVYLVADGKTVRLFPFSQQADALPSGSASAAAVEGVVVAVRQTGPASAYRLATVGGDALDADVALERTGELTLVRVTPGRLPAGDYELAYPRESIYGGEEYVYFRVSP